MQIHFIIFITQLKLASTFENDLYQRIKSSIINLSFVQIENNNDEFNVIFNYEIERLLNRYIIVTNRINYLIK